MKLLADRIGLRLGSLRQPLRKALHTAGWAGVRGVEVDARTELKPADLTRTATRQFRKMLDDLNLQVCAVAFPTRRGYADAEALDRRVAAAQGAMRLAYDLGAKNVILTIGPIPAEGTPARSSLVEVVSALASFADRTGVRLAALTEGDTDASLLDLVGALPQETLGIALHPAILIRRNESPADWFERFGRFVSYLYASDAVRDLADGRSHELELGRGTADLPALLGMLEEYGYNGWVTIDRRESALAPEDAANAASYLKSL